MADDYEDYLAEQDGSQGAATATDDSYEEYRRQKRQEELAAERERRNAAPKKAGPPLASGARPVVEPGTATVTAGPVMPVETDRGRDERRIGVRPGSTPVASAVPYDEGQQQPSAFDRVLRSVGRGVGRASMLPLEAADVAGRAAGAVGDFGLALAREHPVETALLSNPVTAPATMVAQGVESAAKTGMKTYAHLTNQSYGDPDANGVGHVPTWGDIGMEALPIAFAGLEAGPLAKQINTGGSAVDRVLSLGAKSRAESAAMDKRFASALERQGRERRASQFYDALPPDQKALPSGTYEMGAPRSPMGDPRPLQLGSGPTRWQDESLNPYALPPGRYDMPGASFETREVPETRPERMLPATRGTDQYGRPASPASGVPGETVEGPGIAQPPIGMRDVEPLKASMREAGAAREARRAEEPPNLWGESVRRPVPVADFASPDEVAAYMRLRDAGESVPSDEAARRALGFRERPDLPAVETRLRTLGERETPGAADEVGDFFSQRAAGKNPIRDAQGRAPRNLDKFEVEDLEDELRRTESGLAEQEGSVAHRTDPRWQQVQNLPDAERTGSRRVTDEERAAGARGKTRKVEDLPTGDDAYDADELAALRAQDAEYNKGTAPRAAQEKYAARLRAAIAKKKGGSAGAADPDLILPAGGAVAGGAIGATQGDTPDERLRNAALGAAGGFGLGAITARVLGRAPSIVREGSVGRGAGTELRPGYVGEPKYLIGSRSHPTPIPSEMLAKGRDWEVKFAGRKKGPVDLKPAFDAAGKPTESPVLKGEEQLATTGEGSSVLSGSRRVAEPVPDVVRGNRTGAVGRQPSRKTMGGIDLSMLSNEELAQMRGSAERYRAASDKNPEAFSDEELARLAIDERMMDQEADARTRLRGNRTGAVGDLEPVGGAKSPMMRGKGEPSADDLLAERNRLADEYDAADTTDARREEISARQIDLIDEENRLRRVGRPLPTPKAVESNVPDPAMNAALTKDGFEWKDTVGDAGGWTRRVGKVDEHIVPAPREVPDISPDFPMTNASTGEAITTKDWNAAAKEGGYTKYRMDAETGEQLSAEPFSPAERSPSVLIGENAATGAALTRNADGIVEVNVGPESLRDKFVDDATIKDRVAVEWPDVDRIQVNRFRGNGRGGAEPHSYELNFNRIRTPAPETPEFRSWFGDSKIVDEAGKPQAAVHYTAADFEAFSHEAQDAAKRFDSKDRGYTTDYGKSFVFPKKGFFFFVGPDVPGPAIAAKEGARSVPAFLSIKNPLNLEKGISGPEAKKLIDFMKQFDTPEIRGEIAWGGNPAVPGESGFKVSGRGVGRLSSLAKNGMTGQQMWDFIVNNNPRFGRGELFNKVMDELGYDGMIFPSNSSGTYIGEPFRGRADGRTYRVAVATKPEQIKSATGNSGAFDPKNPKMSGFIDPSLLAGAGGAAAGSLAINKDDTTAEKVAKVVGGAAAGALAVKGIKAAGRKPIAPKLTRADMEARAMIGATREGSGVPGIPSVADAIKQVYAPATRGDLAATAGATVRAARGDMDRDLAMAQETLKRTRGSLQKNPIGQNLAMIHGIESAQGRTGLSATQKALVAPLDAERTAIQNLGTGKLDQFIENYFPHLWQDPEQAKSLLGKLFGARPFEGSKSFLKQRTIPTVAEGMFPQGVPKNLATMTNDQVLAEAKAQGGLLPVSFNPVELSMLKLREMRKYRMAQEVIQDLEARGLLKDAPMDKRLEPGYSRIGDWAFAGKAAPDAVARLLNNHLSPGLRGNAAFDAYMAVGNTLNQVQLGLSAFHAGMTTIEQVVSQNAIGIGQLFEGKPLAAAKSFITSPAAPFTQIRSGMKLRDAYLGKAGTLDPKMEAMAEQVAEAGGRFHADFTGEASKTFRNALKAGQYGRAATHLFPALMEKTMAPVMEHLVPLQKFGAFSELAGREIERLGPSATPDQVRAATQKAWDSIDNRFGQLVYDNLFWNKVAKDMAHASVRSVGWNWGTLRELGGGTKDVAGFLKDVVTPGAKAKLSTRAQYAMALPITLGTMGAVTQYLMTGKGPDTLWDYFHPQTGTMDADGNPNRVVLPSYMKDVFAYERHPVQTVTHKLNPLLSLVGDMLQNKNYYGDEIRNGDDPVITQLGQLASYAGKSMVPFVVQNIAEEQGRGESAGRRAASLVGITPASREAVRTPAQNMMHDILARGMPERTPEEVDASQLRSELQATLKEKGQAAAIQVFREKIASGDLTTDQALRMLKAKDEHPLVRRFKGLRLEDAEKVYAKGDAREQGLWAPILGDKRFRVAKANGGVLPGKRVSGGTP